MSSGNGTEHPDRIERRSGDGPEQPVWDDIPVYSPEWYRRFRAWHHGEFPDADTMTRSNLDLLVQMAEENATLAPLSRQPRRQVFK